MRARTTWTAAVLALALAVGLSSPGVADTTRAKKKKVDAAISALKNSLSETSKALQDAAIALERAKSELPAAQAAVTKATRALEQAQARDAELVRQLAVAVKEEDKAERELAAVGVRISTEEQSLGQIANAAYRSGGMGQLAVALDAKSPDEFTDRLVLVQTAMRAGDQTVNELAVAKADMRNSQAKLAAKRQQIAAMREESRQLVVAKRKLTEQAKAAKAEVDRLVAQRSQALAAIAREKAAEKRRLADAQAQSRKLAQQIAAEIARQERARRASRGSSRSFIGVPSGSLLFPAAGPISTYAGYRTNPVTGNPSCHSGIDIAAGGGAPIHAAAAGVVVATTYTAWDGNTTVIDHGGGLTTWYAHQNSFSVHVGQQVSRGQVIGYVGATGFATGPHLHFNVAVNGVAYDPMGWFGGPRRSVQSLCPHGPSAVL